VGEKTVSVPISFTSISEPARNRYLALANQRGGGGQRGGAQPQKKSQGKRERARTSVRLIHEFTLKLLRGWVGWMGIHEGWCERIGAHHSPPSSTRRRPEESRPFFYVAVLASQPMTGESKTSWLYNVERDWETAEAPPPQSDEVSLEDVTRTTRVRESESIPLRARQHTHARQRLFVVFSAEPSSKAEPD
jgi:hypothetical protein